MNNKILVLCIAVVLMVVTSNCPFVTATSTVKNNRNNYSDYRSISSVINESMLDMEFIYSITENLSNIIFTEYDESSGEIAKGRGFGTKGEHKAAEILYENMTKLGLYTKMEQIKNIQKPSKGPTFNVIYYHLNELTHAYDVLDYGLRITNLTSNCNETVVCQISPKLVNPKDNTEKIHNFTYNGLKIRKRPNSLQDWINAIAFDKKGDDYVFIEIYSKGHRSRNPNESLNFIDKLIRKFIYPIRFLLYNKGKLKKELEKKIFYNRLDHYRGYIYYDYHDNTYVDLIPCNEGYTFPRITINGTIGKKIISDIENFKIDFYVKQRFNKSVISYNVIGQLNGTDPSKTVIVGCLYDSVWCQGTADSAIGMAIVLGIAKYFTDHNIKPKYNIKFIGFCGEESGCRGARHYEATHREENIIYLIDMNQVGFIQENPRLTLNFICNRFNFMNEIWKVAKRTDYVKRNGNTTDIAKRFWPEGVFSDQYVFNHRCPSVCFLKDFPWILHHRDGLDHQEGDVMKYFDWKDTSATGEIALNVTLHLTVDNKY